MLELKPYQKSVLNDLRRYLTYVAQPLNAGVAFQKFWEEHPSGKIIPRIGTALEPYKSLKLGNVPNVCIKVPTGGGKTFIGCHALSTIFDFYATNKPRTIVWLVPSDAIHEQTLSTLRNPEHPYRMALNKLFQYNIQVLDKSDLLNGVNFNEVSVQNQVTIVLLKFQSLRAKDKESRKLYQQNGNFLNFIETLDFNETPFDQTDVASPMHALRALNPVIIVDESHNAESDLSVEMLVQLNPSFVLDLTATPRQSANVISFTNSYELKREHMVKLPIFVYNQADKRVVIQSAIDFQDKLERYAYEAELKGNVYIRPIVLFQAQSKTGKEDALTFDKIKQELVKDFYIPSDQIAIKTATINELKNIDLLDRNCPIRYIITVNALKEGWDCSFAYILASLADRHSDTDVTQIVGRILRQPYARSHSNQLLNGSYVFTSSAQFRNTLQRIIDGLKLAGFSDKDYKAEDFLDPVEFPLEPFPTGEQSILDFDAALESLMAPITKEYKPSPDFSILNESNPNEVTQTERVDDLILKIEKTAIEQQKTYQDQSEAAAKSNSIVSPEIQQNMKQTNIEPRFLDVVNKLFIPQFYIKSNSNILFGKNEKEFLTYEALMEGFSLEKEDIKIDFSALEDNIAKIDLDAESAEHKPIWEYAKDAQKDILLGLIHRPDKKESIINTFTDKMLKIIGNIYPIADGDVRSYLKRLFQAFNAAQFEDLLEKPNAYANKIKGKIVALSKIYRKQVFEEWLQTGKITLEKGFIFAEQRALFKVTTADGIRNALYKKEESMNAWESEVISSVANLENIVFWTRNEAKKIFYYLNGYVNHYPDFIALTKSSKIIIIETKGDFLDGSDSLNKIRLGALWEKAMHGKGFYFMIFDKKDVAGGFKKADFLRRLREL